MTGIKHDRHDDPSATLTLAVAAGNLNRADSGPPLSAGTADKLGMHPGIQEREVRDPGHINFDPVLSDLTTDYFGNVALPPLLE